MGTSELGAVPPSTQRASRRTCDFGGLTASGRRRLSFVPGTAHQVPKRIPSVRYRIRTCGLWLWTVSDSRFELRVHSWDGPGGRPSEARLREDRRRHSVRTLNGD